jgi:pimeloyl-ACP methyl ester carboxylesterase
VHPAGLYVVERSAVSCAAPLVVFVHGSPDRSQSFIRAVELLGDVRTVIYDRRGYGQSLGARPEATSIADHVADLLALIDGGPATIIGHSFGGVVAMAAAASRPQVVDSLGLWEPPLPWLAWWPEWARRAVADIGADPNPLVVGEQAFKTVVGRRSWDALTAEQRDLARAEGAAFLTDTGTQRTAPFDLNDVVAPCLVGFGTATWRHQVDGAERLAELLGAELMGVEGAGHFGHATHPEGFAQFVRRAVALGREVPAAIEGCDQ